MQKVLVLIDIQREYITPGRLFCLQGVESSLQQAKKLLAHARQHEWKIIHVRHVKVGAPIFSPDSEYTDFIEGFTPLEGEVVVSKSLYSCYSSSKFCQLMQGFKHDEVFIVGYNSIMCCLSTVISGYHLGHKLHVVKDAMLAKSTKHFTEQENHQFALSTIEAAGYANCVSAEEVMSV
jgi:ureidoacrylate peracid hydrolase